MDRLGIQRKVARIKQQELVGQPLKKKTRLVSLLSPGGCFKCESPINSDRRLPLLHLSHSISTWKRIACLLSCPRRGPRMSDKPLGSTQTLTSAETHPSGRQPSAKELAWEKNTLQPTLEKSPERRSDFTTTSGHPIRRLYTDADLPNWDPQSDLGLPGVPLYTRGIHPTMYRTRLWTMRQFAGFGTAEDTNARFRYLLSQGQTGLPTAFDMPTLMGRDSDDPLSRGEVGREGVAVDTIRDMEILFGGIPVDKVTTSMTINGPASIVWAMYLAAAEERGIPFGKLGGTIQNDCLKEYIAQREWIVPVK